MCEVGFVLVLLETEPAAEGGENEYRAKKITDGMKLGNPSTSTNLRHVLGSSSSSSSNSK